MRRREFLALMGLAAAGLATGGCKQAALAQVNDLMAGYNTADSATDASASATAGAATALGNFGARLALACDTRESNLLVSPLSVAMALTLAANGAAETTLAQMEAVLGADTSTLSAGLPGVAEAMGDQLHVANSIWFREGTQVHADFLAKNAETLGAAAYETAFDAATASAINEWVSQNTDGMIDQIVDEIPAQALLYLVNALALDADWASPYDPGSQLDQDAFTAADGSEQTAEYLCDSEYDYLELEGATGFLKSYDGGKLGFIGFLPNEGTAPEDLLSQLDALGWEHIKDRLVSHEVVTRMPKLGFDWDADLADALAGLGMADAFDAKTANFTQMADTDENLFIGRVLHKTHIDVDEQGTRAAAATAVEMSATSTFEEEPPYEVYLTRPYLFAIVELASFAPAFIGIVRTVE